MAKYFADQAGVFEVAERPDGGKCLRQTVARRGIDWHYYPNPEPYTIIGRRRSGATTRWPAMCTSRRRARWRIFGRIAKSLQDVASIASRRTDMG